MDKNDSVEIVGLASLINSVKQELQLANQRYMTAPTGPTMSLRRMRVEIALVAERIKGFEGKFDLKIAAIGGQTDTSATATHRVELDFDIREDTDTKVLFHKTE